MARLIINKNTCLKIFNKLAESNRKTISARVKIGQTKIAKLPIYLEIEKAYDNDYKDWHYTINAVYNSKIMSLCMFYDGDEIRQVFDNYITFTNEQEEMIKTLINEEVDVNVSFLDK